MGAPVRFRIKGTQVYVAPQASAYDAAGRGRRGRSWTPSRFGPNSVLQGSADQLQRRARDAVRNAGYADTAIEVLVANLIGTGIKPKFTTPDAGLNKELAALWLRWTDEADADGAFDFYGMQAVAVRAMIEAGETFMRFRPRQPGDGLTVPLQLQMLESEFCPLTMNEPSHHGGEIRMGIETDAIGRRAAFWLYRRHPDDTSLARNGNDLLPIRVPAEGVAHLRQMRRPGQLRGEPWLTRTLIKLRELDAYDDAELVRKKTAALFAGFITRPSPETDDENRALGEEPDEDGGSPIATLEPGTMQVLEPGEEVKFAEPADVGGQYETFMAVQLRAIASNAGVLYEQLTGDYSKINDRLYRASVGEFRRRIVMLQHALIGFQFCRPTGLKWLNTVYATGIIRQPDSMSEHDARRIEWVPQSWPYLHPVQDVQAAKMAREAGFKSSSQIIAENGDDIGDVYDELQREAKMEAERGLSFDRRTGPAPQGAPPGPEEGDDDGAQQQR
jgi:lambda family phage portal protein